MFYMVRMIIHDATSLKMYWYLTHLIQVIHCFIIYLIRKVRINIHQRLIEEGIIDQNAINRDLSLNAQYDSLDNPRNQHFDTSMQNERR